MSSDPTKWSGDNKTRTNHNSLNKIFSWVHLPKTHSEKKQEQIDFTVDAKDKPDPTQSDWTPDIELIRPTVLDNENNSDTEKSKNSKKDKTPGVQ
ncbi:MAG: hypothetical protein ACT4NT_05000 [Nitrososphaerota archaeon]